MAVDHSKNRHTQLHPCVTLDLASDEVCSYVTGLLKSPGALIYVHVSPPDGTTRRSQRKLQPSGIRKHCGPQTLALRSHQFPHGLPTLTGADFLKVERANKLYQNLATILQVAIAQGALVSIEASPNSFMWGTSWFRDLIVQHNLRAIDFQQCMWGGKRDRWSRLYVNNDRFAVLAQTCDRSHTHAPWSARLNNVEEEMEYAQPFCDQVANIVFTVALQRGAQQCQPTSKRPKPRLPATRAAEAGWQPRGNKLPQILSEYSDVMQIPWPLPPPAHLPRAPTADELQRLNISGPCKLLSFRGANPDQEQFGNMVEVGFFRTPEQFTEKALALEHPFDSDASVPDDVKRAIFKLLTSGPAAVQLERDSLFQHYESLRDSLAHEEKLIHAGLPPDREKILKKKSFKLFEAMCADAGIEDTGLDLLVAGVPLIGKGPTCSLFEAEDNCAALTSEQLMKSSKWSRPRVLGKSRSGAPGAVRDEVWRLATEEVQRGWLIGPRTEGELSLELGSMFIVSRRFGITQGDKTRPIDDMSDSLVNSAFAASYRLDLPGIDGVAVMARTLLEATTDHGRVQLRLSTGRLLEGNLHSSLSIKEARTLVGRTLDLEAAYKQLVAAPQSMWAGVLAIEDDGGNTRLFGASASVFGFNKLARVLCVLGTRLFGLVWSNYVDDFPQLDIAKSGEGSQATAERFLTLLGWDFSCKPSKRQPYSAEFDVLGATFDFRRSADLLFLVRNKAGRVVQISESVRKILAEQRLTTSDASTLRGRLQFAETHTFGRVLAANLKAVAARASGQLPEVHITFELLRDLEWILTFMESARPRELRARMHSRKLVIFTDAALEGNDDHGSVGMVAYAMEDDKVISKFFFSDVVPSELLRAIQSRTKKVISSLELVAAVGAVLVLGPLFVGFRVFCFVDNEATRASMISLSSPVPFHNAVLKVFSREVLTQSLFIWIARVPSASNPAGQPSRLCLEGVDSSFTRMDVPWQVFAGAV